MYTWTKRGGTKVTKVRWILIGAIAGVVALLWLQLANQPKNIPGDQLDGQLTNLDQRPKLMASSQMGSNGVALKEPVGVAVYQDELYVTDAGNHRVQVFDGQGRPRYAFGKFGRKSGQFIYPNGIGVLKNGNLLISDSETGFLQEFTKTGKVQKIWLHPENGVKPSTITISPGGKILVADVAYGDILLFNQQAEIEKVISQQVTGIEKPQGLVFENEESFWVSDGKLGVLKLITTNGSVLQDKFQITNGQAYSMPKGLAKDVLNRVLIADTWNGKVIFWNPAPQSDVFAVGSFSFPVNLAIGRNNLIYIIDRGKNQIQLWGY